MPNIKALYTKSRKGYILLKESRKAVITGEAISSRIGIRDFFGRDFIKICNARAF